MAHRPALCSPQQQPLARGRPNIAHGIENGSHKVKRGENVSSNSLQGVIPDRVEEGGPQARAWVCQACEGRAERQGAPEIGRPRRVRNAHATGSLFYGISTVNAPAATGDRK